MIKLLAHRMALPDGCQVYVTCRPWAGIPLNIEVTRVVSNRDITTELTQGEREHIWQALCRVCQPHHIERARRRQLELYHQVRRADQEGIQCVA